MAVQQRPDRFTERMRLVARLTEINSLHLSGQGRRAGIDIELSRAVADQTQDGASPGISIRIDGLHRQLETAETELLALETERRKLNNALAGFNDVSPESARDKSG